MILALQAKLICTNLVRKSTENGLSLQLVVILDLSYEYNE